MRLILADDHSLFREALCFYLRQGYPEIEIFEAGNLDEALRVAHETRTDAMLLDYVFPGMAGSAGIHRARQECPDLPIVILSGNISRGEAVEAVRCGAAGVISKDLSGSALIDALKRILGGESIIVSPAWTGGDASAAASAPALEPERDPVPPWRSFGLTPREMEVVRLLARGLDNKTIANELGIASITVRLHLQNAYRKMGARNRLDGVRIALQSGLADA
jgi:two-component system, NarL family, nitrate/nitrite response regulator NarL